MQGSLKLSSEMCSERTACPAGSLRFWFESPPGGPRV